MTQKRKHSLIETIANTGSGFVISWIATPFIMALFGQHITFHQSAGVTAIYTAISLVRGYVVRRVFNRLH